MKNGNRWLTKHVIGISVSESEDLLSYGSGRGHLRELLLRLAQPVLRAGGNLAYGGHFKMDSFTRDLIDLISDEQREESADKRPWIGILYNHSAWPFYNDITDEDEAEYIDACRFVRITQKMAGFKGDAILPGAGERETPTRVLFNKAVVLTAMRRFMAEGVILEQEGQKPADIPAVDGRVLVAGKTSNFTGILPGLYEEALFCLQKEKPLFILGGFGGASAKLAGYLTGELDELEARLDLGSLRKVAPNLVKIESGFTMYTCPNRACSPTEALDALIKQLRSIKKNLSRGLRNGLTSEENKRLFHTTDTAKASALVMRGMKKVMSRSSATKG